VLAAIAPYVDVVTVNYCEIADSILQIAPDYPADYGIPFAHMFDDLDTMHRLTGKPFLIGEFSYRAADAGLPNTLPPFFPTLATQADRAQALGTYLRRVLARPYLVGAHWFRTGLPIPAARRQNQNFGLVTITDDSWRSSPIGCDHRGHRQRAPLVAPHRARPGSANASSSGPRPPPWCSRGTASSRARFACTDGDPFATPTPLPASATGGSAVCRNRRSAGGAMPRGCQRSRPHRLRRPPTPPCGCAGRARFTVAVPGTPLARGPAVPVVPSLNGHKTASSQRAYPAMGGSRARVPSNLCTPPLSASGLSRAAPEALLSAPCGPGQYWPGVVPNMPAKVAMKALTLS
jgi:hypothetical protein